MLRYHANKLLNAHKWTLVDASPQTQCLHSGRGIKSEDTNDMIVNAQQNDKKGAAPITKDMNKTYRLNSGWTTAAILSPVAWADIIAAIQSNDFKSITGHSNAPKDILIFEKCWN